jgi:hypothetical protein
VLQVECQTEASRNEPRAASARPVPAYRVLVGLFLAALVVAGLARGAGDWQKVYVAAGERLRAGLDVYEWNTTGYAYPPFGAWLAVPFADLPPVVGAVAWAAANGLAWLVLFRVAWRLTGGRGLPGEPGTGRADHLAFWLGATLGGYAFDVITNQQTDLFVAALLAGGCGLLVRGRSVAAGSVFGLAAALKCTPLLFAPYLAWRRQWAGAAAVVVVAVGVNLLPDLTHPPPGGRPRLVAWAKTLLVPLTGADFDPGMWASGPGFNHSLSGVLNRWLTVERADAGAWVPRPDRVSTAELKRIVWVAQAGLVLLAAVALWRKPTDATTRTAEFGVVLGLMLLLSPMSSKPHFCALLLPQLLLARVGWERRDRRLTGLTAVAAVLALLVNKDLVGRRAYELLLWNGAVFASALLLFLGCCYARWRYAATPETVTVFAARVAVPAVPERLERVGATPRAAGQPISLRKSSNR